MFILWDSLEIRTSVVEVCTSSDGGPDLRIMHRRRLGGAHVDVVCDTPGGSLPVQHSIDELRLFPEAVIVPATPSRLWHDEYAC